MVSQVGLNTGFNNQYSNYNTMGLNNNTQANLNSIMPNLQNSNNMFGTVVNNDYSNDIMMQKFDTMLNASLTQNPQMQTQNQNPAQNAVQDQTQQQTQNQVPAQNQAQVPANDLTQTQPQVQNQNAGAQTAFTSNPNAQMNSDELTGYLAQRDKNIAYTENNNPYYKSNTGKKTGLILGLLSPIAGKLVELFKGGKFSTLFKSKQLAIACPALGLVGLGIGALIDGNINSNRAKAADQNYLKTPQQTQAMQQYVA